MSDVFPFDHETRTYFIALIAVPIKWNGHFYKVPDLQRFVCSFSSILIWNDALVFTVRLVSFSQAVP